MFRRREGRYGDVELERALEALCPGQLCGFGRLALVRTVRWVGRVGLWARGLRGLPGTTCRARPGPLNLLFGANTP